MKKYQDHYFKKAKKENYPARSVYKLQEIDAKYGLLGPGQSVLDLGAAPGSWTLWAARAVKGKGRVLAVDLQEAGTDLPGNVTWLVGDALEPGADVRQALTEAAPFQVVLSDMAPKTTGVKFADQARSAELGHAALEAAREFLAPGGSLVVKIFEGPDVKEFTDRVGRSFAKVGRHKPKSSRGESKEIFVVARGFKGSGDS
jgi:23S rRNA (uridine2552-2'-O)-methyltransferase